MQDCYNGMVLLMMTVHVLCYRSYIVVAPRLARPSTVYRVVVGILSGTTPVDVVAQMSSSANSLSSTRATIGPGHVQELLIQVND